MQTPFMRLARRMEDLTGDRGVLKQIVRQGTGPVVPQGATVRCMYHSQVPSLPRLLNKKIQSVAVHFWIFGSICPPS